MAGMTNMADGAGSSARGTLRVALLRGDDHHNLYLERLFASRFILGCVVSEPGGAQRRAIWKAHRWRDAGAAEYHHIRRVVFGRNRFRRNYFSPAHDAFEARPVPTAIVVPDINDPRVVEAVVAAEPDVCVITCTTRLSAETISKVGVPIINIHGGHLPEYRGCHCFFTAFTERRFDAIGSTIHFVDVGLDTGDIIEVVKPAVRRDDNPETLYSRAERLAAQRLVGLLELVESGLALPRTPQLFRGRLVLRRHRTPLDDFRYWLKHVSGRLLPPDVFGPVPDHPWESDPRHSRSR